MSFSNLILRRLFRDKKYTAISVLTSSMALATILILVLYVRNELSYDRHFSEHENIYRISTEVVRDGSGRRSSRTSRHLGPFLANEYFQFSDYVRFSQSPRSIYRNDETQFFWDDVWYADASVFDIFSHDIIYGDPESALTNPSSIAISESFSRAYFGDANPIGNILETPEKYYNVSLVFEDLPQNTHLRYSALISSSSDHELAMAQSNPSPNGIFGLNVYTYVKVPNEYDQGMIEQSIKEFFSKIEGSTFADLLGLTLSYHAQALRTIHYDSNYMSDRPTGDIYNLYAFIAISIAIFVISISNYSNLAVARAMKDERQFGIRKILGENKRQLFSQVLIESAICSFLGLAIGLLLVQAIQPYISLVSFLDQSVLYDIFSDTTILLLVIGFAVLLAILASIYPGVYISSASPLLASSNNGSSIRFKHSWQKILIFIQLILSISILAITLSMITQVSYLLTRQQGDFPEYALSVELEGANVIESIPAIANELLRNDGIMGVASSNFTPGSEVSSIPVEIEDKNGAYQSDNLKSISVDMNFVPVMNLEILEGRNFSESYLADSGNSVIVNEALVSQLEWSNPIGKGIASPFRGAGLEKAVIGVVSDFHFASLHNEIEPLIINMSHIDDYRNLPESERMYAYKHLIISLSGENIDQVIAYIESTLSNFSINQNFNYWYISDAISDQYLSEVRQLSLFGTFAAISILITCLGLTGLVAFFVERRIREISIHKILGASIFQLGALLTKSYIYLVLLAALPASILSYLVISNWISLFAYPSDINYWTFLLAVLIVGVVVVVVVAANLLRVISMNPSENMRCD